MSYKIDTKCFQGHKLAKKKTLKKTSPLTFSLLTCLVRSPTTRVRLTRKTRTIKEVLSIIKDKNRVTATTFLPQIPTLFLRKMMRTSPQLNISIIGKKVIIL